VAGVHLDDIIELHHVLAGVSYPAQKWELIAHAESDPVGRGRPGPRTFRVLWSLPTGRYGDLEQILTAAARTARGHPRRRDATAAGTS
jgi:hypothetical protein